MNELEQARYADTEGDCDGGVDDTIKRLHYKRGTMKAKLTRFMQFLNDQSNRENKMLVKVRLEKIEDAFNEFDEVQGELELLDERERNERETVENTFYKTIAMARSWLQTNNANNTTFSSNAIQNLNDEVKLPSIGLPTFKGEYNNWVNFRDTFTSLVHNRNLSEIQKFLYLKSCLKDEASQLLESLTVSANNYAVAWKLLKDRYENERAIVKAHMRALFDLPLVTKNSHKALRQLLDKVSQHLAALKILGLPTDSWDCLIIHLISTKLDHATQSEFEHSLPNDKLPSLKQLVTFLTKKCFTLENLSEDQNASNKTNHFTRQAVHNTKSRNAQQTFAAVTEGAHTKSCFYCEADHYIYNCPKFMALSVTEKYNELRRLKLCTNCLRSGHFKYDCHSGHCKKCSQKHNTMLHNANHNNEGTANVKTNQPKNEISTPKQDTNETSRENSTVQHTLQTHVGEINSETCHFNQVRSQVLLSTAQLLVKDSRGEWHECRALCDSGSQSNFMTKALQEKLTLNCEAVNVPVAGINQNVTNITQRAVTAIRSKHTTFQNELQFLIVPRITQKLPIVEFDSELINYPSNLQIADPQFNKSSEIDMLLGAATFYEVLLSGQIRLGKNRPILQNSKLGWIISGNLSIASKKTPPVICHHEVSNEALDEHLTRFWKMEEVPHEQVLSTEEKYCEELFKETTTRDMNGRFVVQLPLLENVEELGSSKEIALRRFYSIERKLEREPKLKEDYCKFMKEYQELGHMTVQENVEESHEQQEYYLPHHPVLKESSTTTKCRVVFDASCKTDKNISLNDKLAVGPKVQEDLCNIVLRLRLHKYVLSADIKMMYRQIEVQENQRNFQKIWWRWGPEETVKTYTLNTLTYGMASSPYLATRCLKQLSIDYGDKYPRTCSILNNSFYMDDLLVSVGTKEEALEIQKELNEILGSASFELRKWSSNDTTILQNIVQTYGNIDKLIEFHDNKDLKTLGLTWNANTDTLHYTVQIDDKTGENITKRAVLSVICKIFDPLGLVSPAIVRAKIIMQRIWQHNIGWDEQLPTELVVIWKEFLKQIKAINHLRIPRQIVEEEAMFIELHGYSDASERAYGACIYLRSIRSDGTILTNLLCAKSRIAPLKRQTIPRLELMAAVLLSKLAHNVQKTLNIKLTRTCYYSDSTIVLAWIKMNPWQLKTFVANRVSQIRELTDSTQWHYVRSENNPADIISRGLDPQELEGFEKWWHGPGPTTETLKISEIQSEETSLPEVKENTLSLTSVQNNNLDIFQKYSTLTRLQHVVAYCLRFKDIINPNRSPSCELLSVDELERALLTLIKLAQTEDYNAEIQCLKQNKNLNKSSKILNLNPYLDEAGILRVGGRLKNANLSLEQKHPIILSNTHKLTHLIIKHYHLKHLHAGVQTLLSLIRLKFWPVHGKGLVKRVIRSCVICFRVAPKPVKFLMGDLPVERVTPSRPFSKCGMDYAGPILIKDTKLRKYKLIKTYICVFICFATRAIHIELVNDLTTDSFLNALKRFISRRGRPSQVFSDNGTNFIGAFNHFKELQSLISDKGHNERVARFAAANDIQWQFIPPKSPHIGGLWEAAVKSTKFHLRRVLMNSTVDYDEMYTILTQIEACLNSRPLTPLSDDIHDYLPITPAHFLIGAPLVATPQEDVSAIQPTKLSRYQRMQQLVQQFWARWSQEYLVQLQQRRKWQTQDHTKIEPGMLVILREENTKPLQWPMARIIKVHPGTDKVIRVVTVKCANGAIYKRATTKICILPLD